MLINVLCDAPHQLEAALEAAKGSQGAFGEIMIEAATFSEHDYKDIVERCHKAGCACRLALPYIFRDKAETWLSESLKLIAGAHFDGYLVRSLAEFSVVQDILQEQDRIMEQRPIIKTDYNMYAMNKKAKETLRELGADMLTAPVELNERELHVLDISDMELLVYGRIPMMISAQCIKKSICGCENQNNVQIKDRTGKFMPVENVCRLCYNLVYNAVPLSMIGMRDRILKLSPKEIRISFTVEDKAMCRNILKAYTDTFSGHEPASAMEGRQSGRVGADRNGSRGGNDVSGRVQEEPVAEYTRGHFSRGVE